VKAVLCDTAV